VAAEVAVYPGGGSRINEAPDLRIHSGKLTHQPGVAAEQVFLVIILGQVENPGRENIGEKSAG